jgi:hypothetical protein
VIDALLFKRPVVSSLKTFHAKTQLALLKFQHVDIQYIPRWAMVGLRGGGWG